MQWTSCRSRHRSAGFRSPQTVAYDLFRDLQPQPNHNSPSTRHLASGCRAFTPVTCLPCACRSPLLRSIPVVSTPPKAHHCTRVRSLGWRPALSFRPCGSWTTSTASSTTGARACCIPSPDMGFAGFRLDRSWPPCGDFGPIQRSRQRMTLRRFSPRRQPYPVTWVCSLLTVCSTGTPLACHARTDANPILR